MKSSAAQQMFDPLPILLDPQTKNWAWNMIGVTDYRRRQLKRSLEKSPFSNKYLFKPPIKRTPKCVSFTSKRNYRVCSLHVDISRGQQPRPPNNR